MLTGHRKTSTYEEVSNMSRFPNHIAARLKNLQEAELRTVSWAVFAYHNVDQNLNFGMCGAFLFRQEEYG